MKLLCWIASAVLLSGAAQATPLDTTQDEILNHLIQRALPANAPNGYTPQVRNCPSTSPVIRRGGALSTQETEWLKKRRAATLDPMRDLFKRINIPNFDSDAFFRDNSNNVSAIPNIGMAMSGGGYRAMLNGAGHIQAWDSRTPNSTAAGQLGGLLQSTTYLSGLSGGSWLVGSLYTNNFTSIADILAKDTAAEGSGSVWQLGNSIFKGPEKGGIQLLNTADYYKDLLDVVQNKADAGFNTSITDYWGRALSYQLVNASMGGPDYTWSSIADQDFFTSGSVPLPLIVADSRRPNTIAIPENTTVFTFSPWELGTFDPTVNAFAPLKYVGTNFSAGSTTSDQCVTGFDNVGFVMGTSSSLFNYALLELGRQDGNLPSVVVDKLESILTGISNDQNDIADYPNPFFGYNNDTNELARSDQLTLVDGGEDGQNIPLHPLIQPYRNVDVIFAIDSSADTNATSPTSDSSPGWPDGTSLQATYRRSLANIQNGTAFPAIPGVSTFFNQGLNSRPTFFGCDAKNTTGNAPLIVYMPNAPYVYNSNTSTYDMTYNDTKRNAIILNAYNGATQGNATLDANWPACVGCAILSRSLDRTGTPVPDTCRQCFDKYCWNGQTDTKAPPPYRPELKIKEAAAKVGAASSTTWSSSLVGLFAAVAAMLIM